MGGSRGIGRGLVESFVDGGAHVTYFSRNVGKDMRGEHVCVDLESYESIKSAFQSIHSLDILVNVAAINFCKPHEEIGIEEWDSVIDVNLRSFFLCMKLAAERMCSGSKIVNVSSIAGRSRSLVSGVHYTASKAGIIGLTRQMAFELGPRGINVNCVCPSQTMTDMLMESMSKEAISELSKTIPLRRLASVEEIVGPIMFLCSDDSSYVHGACLDINGGQL